MGKLFLYFLSPIILLTVFMGFSACVNDSLYKEVTITREDISFTFEYPSLYEDINNTLSDGNQEDWIDLVCSIKYTTPTDEYSQFGRYDREFGILFFTSSENPYVSVPYTNAKEYLEYYINNSIVNGLGFTLIEKSNAVISGIQAEKVISSHGTAYETYLGSHLCKTISLFFDYRNLIWGISLTYHIEVAEEAEKEFDHIVNSFKFIN